MGFDFVQSAGLVAGRGGQTIAFDRDTSAWYFNSAGTLTSAASDVARFDYNPSTLSANGVLIEAASTNRLRNAVMAGVTAGVIGSGGSIATNWTVIGGTGLTLTASAAASSGGIDYFDLRLNGTTGSTFILIGFESATQIAALSGETWTSSVFLAKTNGDTTNISAIQIEQQENTSGGAQVVANAGSQLRDTINSTLTRYSYTVTLNGGGTTAANRPGIVMTYSSGVAIDITLRIGTPQLEQKGVATSPILSAGAATTRNIDRLSITDLSSFGFNSAQGTLVARVAVGLPASGGNQFIARFSDNSYDNTIALNINSTGYAQLSTASGGVFDGTASDGTILVANTFTTVACSWQSGRLEISQNGGAVTPDTSFTFPTGMTRLDIGSDHAGANAFITGWQKWLRYYPRAITGGALQQLSSQT